MSSSEGEKNSYLKRFASLLGIQPNSSHQSNDFNFPPKKKRMAFVPLGCQQWNPWRGFQLAPKKKRKNLHLQQAWAPGYPNCAVKATCTSARGSNIITCVWSKMAPTVKVDSLLSPLPKITFWEWPSPSGRNEDVRVMWLDLLWLAILAVCNSWARFQGDGLWSLSRSKVQDKTNMGPRTMEHQLQYTRCICCWNQNPNVSPLTAKHSLSIRQTCVAAGQRVSSMPFSSMILGKAEGSGFTWKGSQQRSSFCITWKYLKWKGEIAKWYLEFFWVQIVFYVYINMVYIAYGMHSSLELNMICIYYTYII